MLKTFDELSEEESLCQYCNNKENFKDEEEYTFNENGDLIKNG